MLKFTEPEMTESASSLLSLFYKSTMFFFCYCEWHTNKRRDFTDLKAVLLLSV